MENIVPQRTAKQRTLPRFPKGKRLTEEEAADLTRAALAVYPTMTIRDIATETGRSYGSIQGLLKASGVTMAHGGNRQDAAGAGPTSAPAAQLTPSNSISSAVTTR
ncbi:helix-turn-helix domain-containing protein [Streptomyces sp. Tu6071]|uniref:helix-turn-helix domain-containing protein n=1 Tax=Streptomyces sp. Tu6071 TaxID=355249 RepID=UPI00017FEA91|nr:hypothetical protein SSBG_00979 [Streptomyces sp. SPB074]